MKKAVITLDLVRTVKPNNLLKVNYVSATTLQSEATSQSLAST